MQRSVAINYSAWNSKSASKLDDCSVSASGYFVFAAKMSIFNLPKVVYMNDRVVAALNGVDGRGGFLPRLPFIGTSWKLVAAAGSQCLRRTALFP